MNQVEKLKDKTPLTKEAVRIVSNTLINFFGSTTVLEVRNSLRASNYVAYYEEVENIMKKLSDSEEWYCDENNLYRMYRKVYPFGDGEMILSINPN